MDEVESRELGGGSASRSSSSAGSPGSRPTVLEVSATEASGSRQAVLPLSEGAVTNCWSRRASPSNSPASLESHEPAQNGSRAAAAL